MREQEYYIAVDEYERRIIINSLNALRNKLIANSRYTDVVDDVLIKVVNAQIKKIQIAEGTTVAKTIFEEMGGTYEMQGDHLIPCLTVPTEKEQPIGIWGQRHLDYLKQRRRVTEVINAGIIINA